MSLIEKMQRGALHTSHVTIALTLDAENMKVEPISFALERRVISSAFFLSHEVFPVARRVK